MAELHRAGTRDVSGALNAWRATLGADHVRVDQKTRDELETATYRTARQALGLLCPGDAADVQECVRIANRFGVALYPVSRGRNWGLGSRVAPCDQAMVLSLSRLDRIIEFNEQRAYLTVEPGVSFAKAWEFLEAQDSQLMLNTTMGPPDGSLVGNALERGHGSGMYLDRFHYSCAQRVVLPSGDLVSTGLTRYPNAQAARLHRSGAGPFLDGLFTQSNLGIVTEMTFWLAPKPADITQFSAWIDGEEQVRRALPVLRKLCQDVRFRFQLNNIHRRRFDQEAWGRAASDPPSRHGIDPKTFFSIAGGAHCHSTLDGWALRRRVVHELRGKVAGFQYLSSLRRAVLRPFENGLVSRGIIHPSALRPQPGRPSHARVAAMYAAKKNGPRVADVREVELDRDRCGVMWYCPVLPFEADHVLELTRIVEDACLVRGFEPQLTFIPCGSQSLEAFFALVFDRADPEADQRALQCYDDVADLLMARGYPPYRLPVHRMDLIAQNAPAYGRLLQRLKQALDPNDILAPGRYDGRPWEAGEVRDE